MLIGTDVISLTEGDMEQVVRWRIDTMDSFRDKLDVHQYGALKYRSTTHALVDMMTNFIGLRQRNTRLVASFKEFPPGKKANENGFNHRWTRYANTF